MSDTNQIENLWQEDLEVPNFVLPREILLSQAKFLTERTKNVLVADIRTANRFNANWLDDSLQTQIVYEFIVQAPHLNYQFALLRVTHGFDVYPLVVHDVLAETDIAVTDERQFLEVLGSIFGREKTKRAIQILLAKSA